jgi:hypothetical protein
MTVRASQGHASAFAGLILASFVASPGLGECGSFDTGRLSFSLKHHDGWVSPYRVLAIFAPPDSEIGLEVEARKSAGPFYLVADTGELTQASARGWRWRTPARPGLYPIRVVHPPTNEVMELNVFVLVPLDAIEGGYLNGYRVGEYPRTPLKGLRLYAPPAGLVEVTALNARTPVSPHFRLGQFVCKQGGGYPKYLILRERLLLKLELVLEEVNRRGYRADGFHVMSGYRTPHYNAAIGNVRYSRHVWGGAADIFVDEDPRDGTMDDLNQDGRIDLKDAAVLYDIIDDLYGRPWYAPFLGGLARYRKTPAHGPFVHVDVRGFRARWGH